MLFRWTCPQCEHPNTDSALQPTPSSEEREHAAAREIERLRNDARNLRDVLLRNGFVPCDSPACNCGSWHHRYGLPERMQEIKDELAEAGHELSNANGNLTLNALKALVAERDELRRQLAEAELDAQRYRDWLRGGANIPSESTRWARWEVRYWDGRHWNTLFAEQMDAAIAAAMGGGDAG